MKAIETKYKGYRFRSRLEARWAVFFDVLGVAWEYEPEGYELGGVRYLPDFRIDTGRKKFWVEIKGVSPTPRERQLLIKLAATTDTPAVLFAGDPLSLKHYGFVTSSKHEFIDYTADDDAHWNWCATQLGRVFDRMHLAIQGQVAARNARFEFGESGARA